jgi:ribulose 1,5-bisphosphate synthetase/thiazole synthase
MAQVKTKVSELRQSYDYIVVGGGTSGLTVGDRLSEDGTSESIPGVSFDFSLTICL